MTDTKIHFNYDFALTPLRKEILSLFVNSKHPLKAYEIISILNKNRDTKPIVIYRILNFFIEKKIIHKIQSKNTYVLCDNHLCSQKKGINIFLSCNSCLNIMELENTDVLDNIQTICANKKFYLVDSNIELNGYCSNCKKRH